MALGLHCVGQHLSNKAYLYKYTSGALSGVWCHRQTGNRHTDDGRIARKSSVDVQLACLLYFRSLTPDYLYFISAGRSVARCVCIFVESTLTFRHLHIGLLCIC